MSMQSTATAPVRQSALGFAFWRNRVLIGLVALHFAVIFTVCLLLGHPFRSDTTTTLINLMQLQVPLFLVLLLVGRFVWVIFIHRPKRPVAWFARDLRQILLDPERILTGILGFLTMCVFAGTFAVGKDLIPVIAPFSWDPFFAEIDRFIHFGHDPWRLLYVVTGTPMVTTFINAAYHLWLMLAYFMIFFACFNAAKGDNHRTYLAADVISWVVGGNILATIFSSAGPVYYQAFGYGDAFAPLMQTLYAFNEISPVWALHLQEMLIDGYMNDTGIKGISAMPSMHVASTVTMTLYAFTLSRRLGWLMALFAGLILVGSVQLGWHYAIDGYASILFAPLCWLGARKLIRAFGQ